ncbi:MAG: ribosomal-protein-alanine acetyltransferase [Oscillospiraceae bacterium]|nr:ribosomal-protein-alanine acetyltransferase [Oscillospiraceae bacterium]
MIRVIPMEACHLEAIADIERESFSDPWTVPMLAEELHNDCASYLVAEDESGRVLGYAGLHVVVDEGYITNIAVRGDCRRQGVAGALLGVFERFGKAHLSFLTLEVRESNTVAIGFYLDHGFVQVGRRKGYYSTPREDAILMTLEFQTETAQAGASGG